MPAECAQEFIFPEPAVRVNAAASSDSDATPIGAGTPATRSPTNSLGARLKQQDVAAAATAAAATVAANTFVEPKPVKGAVSLGGSFGPYDCVYCVAFRCVSIFSLVFCLHALFDPPPDSHNLMLSVSMPQSSVQIDDIANRIHHDHLYSMHVRVFPFLLC